MSTSTAIALVGESLRALLDDTLSTMDPAAEVTILPPDDASGDTRRINLFLYKVEENPFLKNKEWEVSRDDPTRITPPPLSLNLLYLMTPYGPNDELLGNVSVHEILGEAMRVLHENPILPEEFLAPGLAGTREQIRIMQTPLDMDELSKIWSTFDVPFRLSVGYEISVVQVDQQPDEPTVMPARVRRIGVPEVSAPFNPPRVFGVSPVSVAAGADITLSGEHLAGWRAYVAISGRSVANAQPISSDAFTVTVPGDIGPGFHQVRVDISRLNRTTLFIEVLE